MGQHSINEINGLLSHSTPIFLRVFQQNRPLAELRKGSAFGLELNFYSDPNYYWMITPVTLSVGV